MFAFPNLEKIFTSIAAAIPARVYCNRAVKSVERPCKKGGANIVVTDTNGEVGHFDEIVFTCDTETTRRVLGKGMRWLEKKLLGNVKYFDDLIVTHEDEVGTLCESVAVGVRLAGVCVCVSGPSCVVRRSTCEKSTR